MSTSTASHHETLIQGVPAKLLSNFFQESTKALSQIRVSSLRVVKKNDFMTDRGGCETETDSDASLAGEGGEKEINLNLNTHRQKVLQIQIDTLEKIISDEVERVGGCLDEISMEQAQSALEYLGSLSAETDGTTTDEAPADTTMLEKKVLIDEMNLMNQVARFAFTRLVLDSEIKWDQLIPPEKEARQLIDENNTIQDSSDNERITNYNNNMKIDDIVDFCALCTTAMSLPEIQSYLRFGNEGGKIMISGEEEEDSSEKNEVPNQQIKVQKRMTIIQNLMLRAVGYDPSFGTEQIGKILLEAPNDDTLNKNEEFMQVLTEFVQTLRQTYAVLGNINQGSVVIDELQDGNTKVISANFKEYEIGPDGVMREIGGAPTNTTKNNDHEENTSTRSSVETNNARRNIEEQVQKQDLQTAKNAALMEQSILKNLLEMNEEKRETYLEEARQTHVNFVRDLSNFGGEMQERIQYLQEMSQEKRHLLLIHKLWENYTITSRRT